MEYLTPAIESLNSVLFGDTGPEEERNICLDGEGHGCRECGTGKRIPDDNSCHKVGKGESNVCRPSGTG